MPVVGCAATVALIAACDGGGPGGVGQQNDHVVDSAALCGKAFPPQAQDAVRYLTGLRDFDGASAEGVASAAAELAAGHDRTHTDVVDGTDACSIYAPQSHLSRISVKVAVVAKVDAGETPTDDGAEFHLGSVVGYGFTAYADVFVPCESPRLTPIEGKRPMVRTRLWLYHPAAGLDAPRSQSVKVWRSNVLVANAVAYAVAKDLKCADAGGLVAQPSARRVPGIGPSVSPVLPPERSAAPSGSPSRSGPAPSAP